MTLGDILDVAAAKLGFDIESGSAERTAIINWANEAVEDILITTGCNIQLGELTTVADEGDYEFSHDILEIHELDYTSAVEGQTYSFDRISPFELLRYRNASAAGTAARFYATNGANVLMLYPTPTGVDTITIYYASKPESVLSAESHDPRLTQYGGIPSWLHKAIEFYVLWQGADQDDDKSSEQGERYRMLYENELKQASRKISRMGGRRPAPKVAGARRRKLIGRPDQDV